MSGFAGAAAVVTGGAAGIGHAWLGWLIERLSPALSERIWLSYAGKVRSLPGAGR